MERGRGAREERGRKGDREGGTLRRTLVSIQYSANQIR